MPAPVIAARLLPLVEFALALALLVAPTTGGLLALVALAAFSAILGVRIRAGTTAPCACFGTASREPVSSVELLRNTLLAALAVAALAAPNPHRPTLDTIVTVSALTVAGAVTVSLARLRQQVGAVWSNEEAREGALP